MLGINWEGIWSPQLQILWDFLLEKSQLHDVKPQVKSQDILLRALTRKRSPRQGLARQQYSGTVVQSAFDVNPCSLEKGPSIMCLCNHHFVVPD